MALISYKGSTRRWRKLRAFVLHRDGGKCQRCGATDRLEAHHVIPSSAGGSDTPSNLRTICVTCHDQIHGR